MERGPLDTDTDLTPSEIDALETIELPKSEQPEGLWFVRDLDVPHYFPGEQLYPDKPSRPAPPPQYLLPAARSPRITPFRSLARRGRRYAIV